MVITKEGLHPANRTVYMETVATSSSIWVPATRTRLRTRIPTTSKYIPAPARYHPQRRNIGPVQPSRTSQCHPRTVLCHCQHTTTTRAVTQLRLCPRKHNSPGIESRHMHSLIRSPWRVLSRHQSWIPRSYRRTSRPPSQAQVQARMRLSEPFRLFTMTSRRLA